MPVQEVINAVVCTAMWNKQGLLQPPERNLMQESDKLNVSCNNLQFLGQHFVIESEVHFVFVLSNTINNGFPCCSINNIPTVEMQQPSQESSR